VKVTGNIIEVVIALESLPGLAPPVDSPTGLTIELCGIEDEFSIYHWDDNTDKSNCFNHGEITKAKTIEKNVGIEVGITPTIIDNCPMSDHKDNNDIWTKTVKIIRSKFLDSDLQIHESGSGRNDMSSNMSRFL